MKGPLLVRLLEKRGDVPGKLPEIVEAFVQGAIDFPQVNPEILMAL